MLLVEGSLYGPCLPADLINASKDYAAKKITEDLYYERIEHRKAYQLRPKQNKDGSLSVIMRCPGCGPGRTVKCDLKPVSAAQERKEIADGRALLPLVVDQPKDLPPVCSNKQSISLPKDFGARYLTALPYKSREWREYYRHARNEMEGKNQFLKDPLGDDIANKGQRRFRGYGKHVLALLVKVVSSNVRTLKNWLDDQDAEDVPPRRRTGRPKKPRFIEKYAVGDGRPIRVINDKGFNKPAA